MEAVAGLLLILFGVSLGVETHCDGRQDGAQCYGALGGTVDIQLMDITSAPRYRLFQNSSQILDLRNNIVIPNITGKKYLFIPSNRTFRINNLSYSDSGNYIFITFDSEGTSLSVKTLQLFLRAPVSSVLLLSECLSQGQMRVSCSSEGGDSPQYSWTLDGRTLTDAELLSGNNEGNIITLKQHVSGHLVCSVKNNVSDVSKGQRISTCGFIFINCISINGTRISKWVYKGNNSLCIVPTKDSAETTVGNSWVICGLKAAVIIVLLIGISIYFAWKRKTNKRCQSSAVAQNLENPEDSVLMVEKRRSATYANT